MTGEPRNGNPGFFMFGLLNIKNQSEELKDEASIPKRSSYCCTKDNNKSIRNQSFDTRNVRSNQRKKVTQDNHIYHQT